MLSCALVATACLVMTVHQIFWLSHSSDPLLASVFRYDTMMAVHTVRRAGETEGRETSKIRSQYSLVLLEATQAIFVGEENKPVRAVILIPRHPLHRADSKIVIVENGTDQVSLDRGRLAEVLARYGLTTSNNPDSGPEAHKP